MIGSNPWFGHWSQRKGAISMADPSHPKPLPVITEENRHFLGGVPAGEVTAAILRALPTISVLSAPVLYAVRL